MICGARPLRWLVRWLMYLRARNVLRAARLVAALVAAVLFGYGGAASAAERWFEELKSTATPLQLYTFLYALPKGGDLHNHLGGAARPEWLWDAALAQEKRGFIYYTKVKIQNCRDYGTNEFGFAPYLLLFKNVQASDYDKLDTCGRSEFKRLQDLDARERAAWLSSLRLDQPYEGRDEFFEALWRRIDALLQNPYLVNDILYRNLEAFGKENLLYLETQTEVDHFRKPDGSGFTEDEVAALYRAELASKEAKATGVEVRFQNALLRFTPNAEDRLRELYAITRSEE